MDTLSDFAAKFSAVCWMTFSSLPFSQKYRISTGVLKSFRYFSVASFREYIPSEVRSFGRTVPETTRLTRRIKTMTNTESTVV